MKNLYLVIFATFILAVLIIYHDNKRSEAIPEITKTNAENIYLVICEGTPVRLKPSVRQKDFGGIIVRSQFQDVQTEKITNP